MQELGHSGSDSSPVNEGYASDTWEDVSAEVPSYDDDDDDDADDGDVFDDDGDDDDRYTDSFDEASARSASPSSSPSSSLSSSSSANAATAVVAAGGGDPRRREILASIHGDTINDSITRRQGNGEDHTLPAVKHDLGSPSTHPVVTRGPPAFASSLSVNLIPARLTQKTESPPLPRPEEDPHHGHQQLDEPAVTPPPRPRPPRPPPPPPPPPGRGVVTRRAELLSADGSILTGRGDREQNSHNNGLATPGGATDVAAAAWAVEPLTCAVSCSSVGPSESQNISFMPPVSSGEESEQDENDDDAEFALLESHLARLGVPPAFSPRRAPAPCLKTPPTRCVRTTCWSEYNQAAEVAFSMSPAGDNCSGQPGTTETNQTAGVESSKLLVAGKRSHRPGTTTGCNRQPIHVVDSNNSISAVTRRSTRRWKYRHHSVAAAHSRGAASILSPTNAVECGNNGGASLVDSRIRRKHDLTTGFHVFPVDGRQPSTTTTARRRGNEICSGGEVVAVSGAVPKRPPPEDLPEALDGVGRSADSEDDDSSKKAANGFVRYPPWTEDRGPSFADELRAVASGIRRQTRLGNGRLPVNGAGRSWDGICQQRNSQGGERYRKARLNRSKRFVRRSLIGRIGAPAAMENLKYPPGCSPQSRAVVEEALPTEGSAKKEAPRSKSRVTSEYLPLKEPSALLGVPEHLTQSFPPTENVVNAQEDAYHHRYYFSRKEGRNTGEDDCQDYFSNTTGLARDRLTTINSNDSVPILGGKECTLSSLRFSRQRAATTTVDRFGSGGRVGGGPCGVVVNQGGTLPGVVEFGGTSPARQMVGFAGHPNHDHGGIGGGFKFNCEVGGSKRSGNSNCSRRGSKSNNDNSRRSTSSSSSSNSDSALDGETIRAFAHRCLAESRTL